MTCWCSCVYVFMCFSKVENNRKAAEWIVTFLLPWSKRVIICNSYNGWHFAFAKLCRQNTFNTSTMNMWKLQNIFNTNTTSKWKLENTFNTNTTSKWKLQNTFNTNTTSQWKLQNTFNTNTTSQWKLQQNVFSLSHLWLFVVNVEGITLPVVSSMCAWRGIWGNVPQHGHWTGSSCR